MNPIRIELAGYRKKYIVCDGVHFRCGNITNGVSFFFSDHDGDYDGCWLMSVEDFLRLSDAVKTELEASK